MLKKIKGNICAFLVISMMMQGFILPANALSTTVSGYSKEKTNTVVIEISGEKSSSSDFVEAFPDLNIPVRKREIQNTINLDKREYVLIPQYYQSDYPAILYGNGTIATSGCSITSIAMVATYLTGYQYMPDELAYYFGGRAENNMARLELASEALGLPYEKPKNWHYTLAELEKGKVAIVLVNENSPFTESQHFIVLTGMTEDGRIMVNDPFQPNYEKWDLKQGFDIGFDQSVICMGYEGAWVYDKSEIPEDILRYVEEEPTREGLRYPDIELSIAEKQLIARVVWAEARGECAEGQQAVAEVVLNRMASENFPDTLKSVIFGEGQFRSVPYLEDAQPGQAQYTAVDNAINGPYVLPEDVVYFATSATNDNVWGTIGGHIFCYEND